MPCPFTTGLCKRKIPSNLPPIWTSPRSFPGEFILFGRILPAGMPLWTSSVPDSTPEAGFQEPCSIFSSISVRRWHGFPKNSGSWAFAREASDLLSEIKKKSRLPLVTKAAGQSGTFRRNPDLFFLSSRGVLQRTFQTTYHSLVLEAVDRSRDSSSSGSQSSRRRSGLTGIIGA